MSSPTPAKITAMGKSTIIISGQPTNTYKTEILMTTKMGKIKSINWLDRWGFAIQTKMQLGGIPIEIKQSTETKSERKA